MHVPNLTYLSKLAEDAGQLALSMFEIGSKFSWKPDNTPVTGGDKKVNAFIIRKMEQDFPDVHLIGEEGCGGANVSDWILIFDPIDGTRAYQAGFPGWAIAIALLHKRQPVAAVIHDPVHHGTWAAAKGSGAFLNGSQVQMAAKHGTIERRTVCLVKWDGCPYDMESAQSNIKKAGGKIFDPPSIVYAGGLLASGGIAATVFPGTYAWETAAMQIIVEEAGGCATSIQGKPLRYHLDQQGKLWMDGHIMSCSKEIQEELVRLVQWSP